MEKVWNIFIGHCYSNCNLSVTFGQAISRRVRKHSTVFQFCVRFCLGLDWAVCWKMYLISTKCCVWIWPRYSLSERCIQTNDTEWSVKLADKSDTIRFWATNHLSTAANPNVTSNIPCGKPRVWWPCFSHKLKHSRRAKTSEFQTNLHMT